MSQTEKRYNKHIGKLFWCGERTYNTDVSGYHHYFTLVMIRGIEKEKYNKKYQYIVDVISSPYKHNEGETYKVGCAYFCNDLLEVITQYGNGYFPATTGDLEKDVAQIQKAC
jgi:hypothetical protein